MSTGHVIHLTLYEHRMSVATYCDRTVTSSLRTTQKYNEATCAKCREAADGLAHVKTPRVLPPSDEWPL